MVFLSSASLSQHPTGLRHKWASTSEVLGDWIRLYDSLWPTLIKDGVDYATLVWSKNISRADSWIGRQVIGFVMETQITFLIICAFWGSLGSWGQKPLYLSLEIPSASLICFVHHVTPPTHTCMRSPSVSATRWEPLPLSPTNAHTYRLVGPLQIWKTTKYYKKMQHLGLCKVKVRLRGALSWMPTSAYQHAYFRLMGT